ncbi:hypothetical protein GA0116948_105303 [Chitinophaga costaii]|uniref:KTSC domain-containing protein n=1 Tax=Chitinophaga costaii TaxID=1335309 RepID=A0A1C4DJ48_9BACT|nr:hypothetical protein [Chitinophaga costaii]PUZ24659.1 hypothetical protein DCM91_12275 [Chitinophaga costaii]SCC31379.1 hypothetical protein GA0116948_105303 [Chitinophaga costaii]
MKKLFFVLICTVVGLSASANSPKSKKNSIEPIKVEIGMRTTESAFRIQKSFVFHDSCGQTITVYVSAPNGTFWADMGSVAGHYVVDHLDSNGCFHEN